MRKVYIEAKVSLIINIDESVDVDDFLSNLEISNNDSRGDVVVASISVLAFFIGYELPHCSAFEPQNALKSRHNG